VTFRVRLGTREANKGLTGVGLTGVAKAYRPTRSGVLGTACAASDADGPGDVVITTRSNDGIQDQPIHLARSGSDGGLKTPDAGSEANDNSETSGEDRKKWSNVTSLC
jgi:hypothetical protein